MKHLRLLQKNSLKEKHDNANKELREKQRARDLYEMEHLGGYEKIYPLSAENPKQIRYNEIVKAVYNNEADAQIRKATGATSQALPVVKPKPIPLKKPPPPQEPPREHRVPLTYSQRLAHHYPQHAILFKMDPNFMTTDSQPLNQQIMTMASI